ncbi:tetratricopeptide repeat protein [Nostoc sp. UHCC 0302]|uniref:CHAT domain-containing protein n=1 Tax=Nostoc sp. UHCC 0302 TaxID=3134896 RepID=UPI00311CC443
MTPNANAQVLLEQGHDQLDRGNYQAAFEIFHQAALLEPQNPQVLYGLGLTCDRLEQYQEALVHLNQALTIQPNYILALARRGLVYQKLKQTQEAQVDFEQAIALTPQDAEDWRGRGIALDELGRYEDAIVSYNEAIEIKPDDHSAWYNRGITLGNLGRYEEAIVSYDKAIEIKPDDYLAWNRRGAILCDFLKKYEEALASFDTAIESKPDDHDAWYSRGNALYHLGRYEEAIISYDKAIEMEPDYYWAWNNRGTALANLGRYEDALASYDKAVEFKPDDYSACNNRGLALANLGRHEDALASYDKAIEFKLDDYSAWNNRGTALANLGRYEDALASYDKAIEFKPDDHDAWFMRGLALANLGRYEDAFVSYDKAIEFKLDDYSAWNNRGTALANLGRYEDALASYDKAIEFKPDDHDAWFMRGLALANLGRYEDALVSYDKAIEIKPDDHYAWLYRGVTLYNLGQYEEALVSYDKAIEIKPDDHYAWCYQGIALSKLGRDEEALASYDKAIEIKPDSHGTWLCRGIALSKLGRDEEALASYDKAIEIKPDDYGIWSNRGNTLKELGRYEQALVSYDKAIEIKPDDHIAWYQQGVILCDFLGRYPEAIANFDQVLFLTDKQFWQAWDSRSVALSKSGNIKAAIETLNNGIKVLRPQAPDFEKGCGELHRHKGKTLYNYGKKQLDPFPDWFAAKTSYEQALNFLSFENFPQQHLQILEELLQVCSALGDTQTLQRKREEATQRVEELVGKCQSKGQEISLRRKFAAFDQLRVDIHLKSPNKQQHIEALELAEARKNTCLAWLREGWDYQPSNFKYQDMQRLLNSKTAAVYWHISPNAITTFIIKHNQPPLVLQSKLPPEFKKQECHRHLHQLRSFQTWMEEWKQAYQDYCQGNYSGTAKETAPWRQNMELMLQNKLRNILEIDRIGKELKDIDHLILIPHRELHLLPLDYLFPGRFTITYLPSFHIGFKLLLQESSLLQKYAPENIVNVAARELPFAAIESAALSSLYPDNNPLRSPVRQEELITALRNNGSLFHFAGHADHIPENPRESFLLLTNSEQLTLGNIVDDDQLDLQKYELICLSACETGITSSETLTDEYVGLVSGFLAKGANYVLSSLWRVDERSSALLIIKFYQLFKQGKSPATALKEAKDWLRVLIYQDLAKWYQELAKELPRYNNKFIAFLKTEVENIQNNRNKLESSEPPFAHPYHWAGFIITGKPVFN